MDLWLFDACAYFGPYHRRPLDASPDAVTAKLESLGVSRMLVASLKAIEYEMHAGNAETLAAARRDPARIEPVAVVNPGEFRPGAGQLVALRRGGFRVAAFYPGPQRWPLDLASFRLAAREASAAGMLILLVVEGRGEMSRAAAAVRDIATPVILRSQAGGGYMLPEEMLAIAAERPNISFDVWNCLGAGQIEMLAREVGADRLLWGSGTPLCSTRSAFNLLLTAGLAPADLALVAGGTLNRLLGDGEPPAATREVALPAEIGRPKIDIHYHFGDWYIPIPRISREETGGECDTFGVRYCLMSATLSLLADPDAGDAAVAAACAADDRLRGYVYLDPMHPRETMQRLQRLADNPRFVGVKTRPDFHAVTLEHPGYAEVMAEAARLRLPLLTHNTGVEPLAKRLPELNIIVAHSDYRTGEAYAGLRNVHFCIAYSTPTIQGAEVRRLLDAVGVERVLYGSDGPLLSPAWTLGKFADANLSAAEEHAVYEGNARRLFGRL